MKKSNIRLTVLLMSAFVMVFAISNDIKAQNSNILYGSSRTPQMNSVNPAFFPSKSRMYLALPGVNMNLSSPLSYSDIFTYDSTEQKTYINANSILDTLSNDGRIRFATNVHAVGLGFRFGSSFITLSTQMKLDLGVGLPQGLIRFLNEGNYNYTGDNYMELLDGQLVTTRLYGEAAIGYGREVGNFTFGARAKLLVGYLDLSSAGSSLKLYTDTNYSSITADVDLQLNYASAIQFDSDAVSGKMSIANMNYMPQNIGINFDLGVRYEDDLFDLSASIIDLGPGIHWKENVQHVVSARENNTFTFTGVDVSGMMSGGEMDSSFTQTLIDSLSTLTEYKFIDGEDYWTTIPTKVNLGGMFKLSPGLNVGVLFHGEFERGLTKVGDVFKTKTVGFYSTTSVLGRFNLRDWIEIVGSFSVVTNNGNWSWFNPGFGVTLTPFRAVQIYMIMDYISNRYIVDAKQFNITAGFNLLFGSSYDRD